MLFHDSRQKYLTQIHIWYQQCLLSLAHPVTEVPCAQCTPCDLALITISRDRSKGERSQLLDLRSLRAEESFKAVYVGISHMSFFTMLFTEWMLGQRATRISLFPLLPPAPSSKPWVAQTTTWVWLTNLSSWNIAVSWIQLHAVSSLTVPEFGHETIQKMS